MNVTDVVTAISWVQKEIGQEHRTQCARHDVPASKHVQAEAGKGCERDAFCGYGREATDHSPARRVPPDQTIMRFRCHAACLQAIALAGMPSGACTAAVRSQVRCAIAMHRAHATQIWLVSSCIARTCYQALGTRCLHNICVMLTQTCSPRYVRLSARCQVC